MDRDLATARSLFALGAVNGTAPDWLQLTPNTTSFATRDGRGPFTIKNVAALIQASLQGGDIGLDYDHATDLAAKAGISAPAAGWIFEIAEHGPNNEPGLWGHVKWTPKGKQAVEDGDYRYISPVLLSNKANELIAISRAALTNDPALVMKGLFSMQETDDVNRQQLCDALSLPATASTQDIIGAVKKSGADVKKKLASALGMADGASDDDLSAAAGRVGAQASTLANVARVLAAAGLTGDALDDATTVALCAKLKGSSADPAAATRAQTLQGQVDDLQKQLASLNARLSGNDAKTEVEAAIIAGKLTPAQKDWAIDYCTREPDGFRKFVGAAPVVLKDGKLIAGTPPGDGGLSEAEIDLCSTLGITPEDFKATRATSRKEGAQ